MAARLVAVIGLAVVGCSDPKLVIDEEPGSEFFLPGSRTFPPAYPDVLHTRVLDGGNDPEPSVNITVITGQCHEVVASDICGRFDCMVGLQYDAPGLCLVRLDEATGVGVLSACWYRGLHEVATLDDAAEQDRLAREDKDAYLACQDQ